MMYRRTRRWRKYRRGNASAFRYSSLMYYTHRYRNSFAYVSTAGFYDNIESKKKETCGKNDIKTGGICIGGILRSYYNDSQEFKCLFPDLGAPTTLDANGAPYFQKSKELKNLLARYSKYKLVSVKHYAKNFKFLQITVRVKDDNVTREDRLNAQKYLIQKYDGGGDLDFSKDNYLPSDKFDVTYQYVPSMSLEIVYRNHTAKSCDHMETTDVQYEAGNAPLKIKRLYAKSVMRETYYPRATNYLNTYEFFSDKYSSGNFKKWLDAMGVSKYPNYTFGRVSLGPDQYIDTDLSTCHFNVVFCDISTYYRFKFSGINNLDTQ